MQNTSDVSVFRFSFAIAAFLLFVLFQSYNARLQCDNVTIIGREVDYIRIHSTTRQIKTSIIGLHTGLPGLRINAPAVPAWNAVN